MGHKCRWRMFLLVLMKLGSPCFGELAGLRARLDGRFRVVDDGRLR